MNITSWLLLLTACAALCGLTWWACARRYGLRNAELQLRLEKTRQAAHAFAAQARKQIGQLQRDLTAQQRAHHELLEARRALQAKLDLRAAALNDMLAAPALSLPASGFADTLPMM